jgi:two-component system, LytTR family, sensor histidine kinase AlgZ
MQIENNMNELLHRINTFLYNEFIFSSRYRVWRHVSYWLFHIIIWAAFWVIMDSPATFWRNLFNMSLWVPVFILFSYPLVYFAVPHLLLRRKVWQFLLLILAWGAAGLYINFAYRSYVYIPLQQGIGFEYIPQTGLQAHSYLCMTTSAASPMLIKFFKLWTIKQRDWLRVQQEKITAELQLLKAQVHPHFLFNTLNNIYSFSLDNSPKTPELILKLSSLLSYMLYDCKTEEVRLEKEIEIMKNYLDLERERYGNKIEISWSVGGNIKDKFVAPLLLLPFLENAFKHGASEQIEKPWLGVDISVKNDTILCKIVNSKNEYVQQSKNGIGINNVKKRLQFLYHGKHELHISDEGNFFVVSIMLVLSHTVPASAYSPLIIVQNNQHETTLPAYR